MKNKTITRRAIAISAFGAVLGLASIWTGIASAGAPGNHVTQTALHAANLNRPLAILDKPGIHSLVYSSAGAAGGETVFLGYENGILVSREGGATWQAVDPPGAGAAILGAQGRQPLYMARGSSFYRSYDGGASWQQRNSPTPDRAIRALGVGSMAHLYAAVADSGVFSSPDGGDTWQRLPTSPVLSVAALAVGESQTLYAATTGSMVLATSDGGKTWRSTGSGLGDAEVTGLATNERTGDLYASTSQGLYHLPKSGNRWQRMSLGRLLVTVAIGGPNDSVFLAVTKAGEVFRSRDGGITWGT